MKLLVIKKADYIDDYKIKLIFNDNKIKVIDFGKFLFSNSHPQYDKYRQLNNFCKFKIEGGNIIWGKNWDLIFPLNQLYSGEIKV